MEHQILREKVNKYLYNIICQYVSYDLTKLFDENYHIQEQIFHHEIFTLHNVSLIDLMITCLKLGYKGFYIRNIKKECLLIYKTDPFVINGTILISTEDEYLTVSANIKSNNKTYLLPWGELMIHIYHNIN